MEGRIMVAYGEPVVPAMVAATPAKRLLLGHRADHLDNLSCGHAEAVLWGPLTSAITQRRRSPRSFQEHQPVASSILPLSAYVGESLHDPPNIIATIVWNPPVLEAAREQGLEYLSFKQLRDLRFAEDLAYPRDMPQSRSTPTAAQADV